MQTRIGLGLKARTGLYFADLSLIAGVDEYACADRFKISATKC